jgi:hypothetical protein
MSSATSFTCGLVFTCSDCIGWKGKGRGDGGRVELRLAELRQLTACPPNHYILSAPDSPPACRPCDPPSSSPSRPPPASRGVEMGEGGGEGVRHS